jgi:riboflavin synthase
MFTGIIEEIGHVTRIQKKTTSLALTIQAKVVLDDVKLGDSIAVNGVCLTVTKFSEREFDVDVMPETFQATALHELSSGSNVNLERSMPANGRFGGHFVSGHVDGVGVIKKTERVENALYLTIQVPSEYRKTMMIKGSIAVDGTSLTIFELGEDTLTISLIPHTQGETILAGKMVGDTVNIECDMLAKYVQQILIPSEKSENNVSMDLLKENGFA